MAQLCRGCCHGRHVAGERLAAGRLVVRKPGGVRNLDNRYCWARDATVAVSAVFLPDFRKSAMAWRERSLLMAAGGFFIAQPAGIALTNAQCLDYRPSGAPAGTRR